MPATSNRSRCFPAVPTILWKKEILSYRGVGIFYTTLDTSSYPLCIFIWLVHRIEGRLPVCIFCKRPMGLKLSLWNKFSANTMSLHMFTHLFCIKEHNSCRVCSMYGSVLCIRHSCNTLETRPVRLQFDHILIVYFKSIVVVYTDKIIKTLYLTFLLQFSSTWIASSDSHMLIWSTKRPVYAHGGYGQDDVRLQKALILSLNASCLAEMHKSSSLSQTIPPKVCSLSLVRGSLY